MEQLIRRKRKGAGPAAAILTGVMIALTLAFASEMAGAAGPLDGRAIPQDLDRSTRFDANQIDMWVTNHGSFAYDIETQNSGLIYPKGSQNTVVFASGLWIGAMVDGAPRVAVNEYSWETTPGRIEGLGPAASYDDEWASNPRWRTYKIAKNDDGSNPDYAEWPVEDGAPVDAEGNPLVLGDQTLWAVYHDLDPSRHDNFAGGTDPLGIEIQQTTFGFELEALQDVVFLKFLITNKGESFLDDTYVSVWMDPDLGGAGDDFVGTDVDLSLGYCYNATNRDNLYGARPPAVGVDFFQGPIVPSVGDTAHVSGVAIPDYKNLGMASFNKYINGTDPASPTDTYNYMRGLQASGAPLTDPETGEVTTFAVNGDPVQDEGWIDKSPADRRMMLSSGPFDMPTWEDTNGDGQPQVGEPGVQEVVAAVVIGQGADRLSSISVLRFNDTFAQYAFDTQFDLPAPPPAPVVRAAELDGMITLSWDDLSEIEYEEPGYHFEGYTIYQLAEPNASAERKRVATFDVNNGTGLIFDRRLDKETGVVVDRPVQFGSDAGIARAVTVGDDLIRGGELKNGTEYYYLVTAYSYNPDAAPGLQVLESAFQAIAVVPQSATAGTIYEDGRPGDVLPFEHVAGDGDGAVVATIVDPSSTTGETYRISFETVAELNSDGEEVPVTVWNLSTTSGRSILEKRRNQQDDLDYLVADGVLWKVLDGLPGWRRRGDGELMIDEIAGPGGVPIEPDGNGGPGNTVWHDDNSTGEWSISAGGADGGEGQFTRFGENEPYLTQWDVEMRWDYSPDNYGWWVFEDDSIGQIPFGLYHVDPVSGAEERLIPIFYSGGHTTGVYDIAPAADSLFDGHSGYPMSDWCYAYTFDGDYEAFLDDIADGYYDNDTTYDEIFARCIIASENGVLPAEGTVIKFSTRKRNTSQDVYEVSTRGVRFVENELMSDLDRIRAVPNPYRNHSNYELNQFERRIKFTNMPAEATVRIFNLAGDLVRVLEKESGATSIVEWDLQTDQGLPVASGLYIYHIQAKDGGKVMAEKTGKVAIFMEKERLNFF